MVCAFAVAPRNVLALVMMVVMALAAQPAHSAPLVTEDFSDVVSVRTADWPAGGWMMVFEDALNGSISEFRIAGVDGGANLCADGSTGARSGLFEKVWGNERGAHWLSGTFGRTGGASALIESSGVRARIVQDVWSTDIDPGEMPAYLSITYTIYHTGRMYIEAVWELNDRSVLGTAPYADNSWRLVLANRGQATGFLDEAAHAGAVSNGVPGLPSLVFSAYPAFWLHGRPRYLDDPDTRTAWFGPAVFDVIDDPLNGITGLRCGGSFDAANPYATGDRYRHVFLVDWSQPGEMLGTAAAEAGHAFAHPDPFDHTPGNGWMVEGTLEVNDPGDVDHDGFAEGEGCHVAAATSNVISLIQPAIRMTPEGEMIPLREQCFKITGFHAVHDSIFLMASTDGGANWQFLTPGEDYIATTHADEISVGTDVRLLSITKRFPVSASVDVRLAYGELAGLITPTELGGPEVTALPGEIVVSWTASDAGAWVGYFVSRMDVAQGNWIALTPDPVSGPSWTDHGAIPGHWYRYRVEALPAPGHDPCVITSAEPVRAIAGGRAAGWAAADDGAPALRALPNPFNPVVQLTIDRTAAGTAGGTLEESGAPVDAAGSDTPATLEIYDQRGRVVRRFAAMLLPAPGSAGVVTWDGRDDRGDTVPSGVYIARLREGGRLVTRKLVLAK